MNNDTKTPHADLIKAWTDGAKIQIYLGFFSEGNVFQTEKEAEVAVKRLMSAFRGEEPEEVKKLRKENEELKKEIVKDEAEIDALGVEVDALKSVMSEGEKALAQLNLSEGESALIQALRNGEIVEVFYGDVCQLIMEVSMPDAVYDALEKIQAEQKARNE